MPIVKLDDIEKQTFPRATYKPSSVTTKVRHLSVSGSGLATGYRRYTRPLYGSGECDGRQGVAWIEGGQRYPHRSGTTLVLPQTHRTVSR